MRPMWATRFLFLTEDKIGREGEADEIDGHQYRQHDPDLNRRAHPNKPYARPPTPASVSSDLKR